MGLKKDDGRYLETDQTKATGVVDLLWEHTSRKKPNAGGDRVDPIPTASPALGQKKRMNVMSFGGEIKKLVQGWPCVRTTEIKQERVLSHREWERSERKNGNLLAKPKTRGGT